MRTERWTRIRRLFEHALELEAGAREGWLQAEADGDEELLRQVRRMLAADERDHTPVEDAGPAVVELLRPAAMLAEIGDVRVDPYRVVRCLGRGGMGAVYLAERADGSFERTVALKLVHGGFDSAEVLARFRAERRILAGLEHPNIARLYDAGVASDGRPFLVMEHVEGVPIGAYADREALDLEGRIRLFLQVCDAVTYAHQSLVIHRDLKPSNILVDAAGGVKLLDFGIAKLAEGEHDEAGTRTGLGPLTPEYASPEQLRGDRLSTSTDVYSLGSVLYELLTGHRPFDDPATAMEHAFGRIGRDTTITLPSRRASEPLDGEPMHRTARWARELRGDLDRALLHALSRDPEARYPSVSALADDLRRYLAGRPIQARPPALGYRVRKFVGRNRLGVTLSAAALLGLVAATAVAMQQARRAQAERETAEGVATFLEDLFRASDPRGGQVRDTTPMGDFLETATSRVREGMADEPEVRARLLYVLGSIHRNLTRVDVAEPLFREAVRANRDVHGPGHPDEIQSRELLGLTLTETGSFDAGLAQLDTALALQRAREGEDAMMTWRLRERIGQAYATVQRNEEALPHLQAAVEGIRTSEPFEPARLASALNVYGSVLGQMNRWEEAAAVLREAAGMTAEIYGDSATGPGALDEAVQRMNLGFALFQLARLDDAEAEIRRGRDLLRGRVGPAHAFRARMDIRLAEILGARLQAGSEGRLEAEADSLFRAGLAVVRTLPELTNARPFLFNSYARSLRGWGRAADAERVMIEAMDAATELWGADHPLAATIVSDLGRIEAELGRVDEGLARTTRALAVLEQSMPAEAPPRLNAAANQGRVLLAANRPEEALAVLEPALAAARSGLAPEHPMIETFETLIREAGAVAQGS